MAGLLSRLGRKQKKTVRAAVVVAAGSATRMEGIDKVLTPLADVPVLVRTLRVFRTVTTSTRSWWSPGRTCWWR